MSGLDKILISDMMGSFVSEAPPIPFVSYCVVCNVFLTQDEMVYEKGHVFHKDCFESHGKDYPDVNHALNSLNSNAKVQLVQLKNLKIRKQAGLVQKRTASKPKPKTKRKVKKKRPKRKTVKKRSVSSKRKKTYSRKKRSSGKKRTFTKKRKKSKKSSRKTRSKPRRRTAKKKTRRRR
jgi:hypothetical protein